MHSLLDLIDYLQSQDITEFSPKRSKNPRIEKWKDTKKIRSLYQKNKWLINNERKHGLTRNGIVWYDGDDGRRRYRVFTYRRPRIEKRNGLNEGRSDQFSWNRSQWRKQSRVFQRNWKQLINEAFEEDY